MPDTRRHRGPHPRDEELFAPSAHATLREAVADLCWLLSRGYAARSALKLVGDRFELLERQRTAVMRSACAAADIEQRWQKQQTHTNLRGQRLTIDGFNLLTTIEAALAGGVLLLGADGCLRDMASMHGSYRRVAETRAALELIGEECERLEVAQCRWWLDRPVSNSARLQATMLELAGERTWHWEVELLPDPDGPLKQTSDIIVTADAAVLDGCRRWFNFARELVESRISTTNVVDLGG